MVAIVDLEGEETFFVVKFELLDKRELLSELEEVTVLLGLFWLVGLRVRELVIDIDRHVVVVVHSEVLNREMRSEHGTVQSGTSRDALRGIKGS